MSNPFRILIIDDDVFKSVSDFDPESGSKDYPLPKLEGQHCQFVRRLIKERSDDVEILVANEASFRSLFQLTPRGKVASPSPAGADIRTWLSGFHVVILDMGDIGPVRDEPADWEAIISANLSRIKHELDSKATVELKRKEVDGVKFYHHYFKELALTRAVIVLTHQDEASLGSDLVPTPIARYLRPFCLDENHLPPGIPWTINHGKADTNGERISRLIQNLLEDFTNGYVMLTNRGQIEFAATTDLPVLIVGESGTGKEYVAGAVRRAWGREKNAGEKNAGEKMTRGYAVLNCGCLMDSNAHEQLFGAVRGAASGVLENVPGIILQACGCPVIGYEKPNADYDIRLRNALDRAERTSKRVEALAIESDKDKAFTLAKSLVADITQLIYPKTDTSSNKRSGKADISHSLPQLLEDVCAYLKALTDGTTAAFQFKDKLIEHFKGILVKDHDSKNPYDLKFSKNAGYLGTLVLDEFADLPPLGQSLLLRFLEDMTKEIRPLGYPGRISGIRLKVIAATSDASIAEMVGVTGLTDRAGGRARQFPIREDLVQRLRWHVIRVDPVTKDNAKETIEMLEERVRGDDPSWSKLEWSKKALKALEAYVLKQVSSPSFNHRREIVRIITLANEHVSGGRKRGLPDFSSGKVSAEIVGRFLKPIGKVTPGSAEESPNKMDREQSPALMDDEIKLRGVIKKRIPSLRVDWNHLDLRNAVKIDPTLIAPIQDLIWAAIRSGQSGKFGRGPHTPYCGIAHALSNGKKGNKWEAVRKALNAADIRHSEGGASMPE